MASYDLYNDTADQKLLFDLRQSWAMNVDRYFQTILYYKIIKRDYAKWHETMLLVSPVIFSRIKKKRQETFEKFDEIKKEIKKVITKYKTTFLGMNKSEEGVEIIIEALIKMEQFLGEIIEKNNMYGTAMRESVV